MKSICLSSEISSISFLLAQWLPESHFGDTFKSNYLRSELDRGILKDFIKATITLVWHCLHPFPGCFPLHLTNYSCLFKPLAARIAFCSAIWDHIRRSRLLVWGLMQPHQFSSSLSQKWEEEMAESFPSEGRALDTLLKIQAGKGTKSSFLHLSCIGLFFFLGGKC